MSNFYLDSIKDEAKVMIDLYSQEEQPVVDIIMCSMRPELIGRIAENINRQNANIGKVVFIPQNYSEQQINIVKTIVTNCVEFVVLDVPENTVLGAKKNIAHSLTTANYVSIFDDDDIYFPNFLKSQINHLLKAGKPAIASISNPIGRNEKTGCIGFLLPRIRRGDNLIGAGGSIVYHREIVDLIGFKEVRCGYDSHLIKDASKNGYTTISTPPFNFIVTRGRGDHTWNFNRKTGIVYNNVTLAEVEL